MERCPRPGTPRFQTRHGRTVTRTYKVVTIAAGILFPDTTQAVRITRTRKRRNSRKRARTEIVYAVTSLSAEQARPAELAAYIRGHWHVGRVGSPHCCGGPPSEPGEWVFPAPRLKRVPKALRVMTQGSCGCGPEGRGGRRRAQGVSACRPACWAVRGG